LRFSGETVGVAFVNKGDGGDWTATAHTTFSTAAFSVSAGNFIIVVLGNMNPPFTVNDTAGNTYIPVPGIIGGSGVAYYAKNILGNAANVVTATFASSSFIYIVASQYSGVDKVNPIGNVVSQPFGSLPAQQNGSTPNFTTQFPDEAVHAWCVSSDASVSVGTGYSAISIPVAAPELVEWKSLVVPQTINATCNFTTLANWGLWACTLVGAGQRKGNISLPLLGVGT
jgi:hypothetical protein